MTILTFSKERILSNDFSTLSNYYSKIGNWDKALLIERSRAQYWKKLYDEQMSSSYLYSSALQSFMSTLANSGKYKEAFRVCKQMIEIDSLTKYKMELLGDQIFNLRNYQEALSYYQAAMDGNTGILGKLFTKMAMCYAALGKYEQAIQIQKKGIAEIDKGGLLASLIYDGDKNSAIDISNLAYLFNLNEQYDSALVYEKKSLEIKERNFSPMSDEIAYSYMNIGIALGGKGRWKDAIQHLLYCYNIYKEQRQRKYYHRTLYYLSKYCFNSKDYNSLEYYVTEFLNSSNKDLLSTLQELTYGERSKYIEEYSDFINHIVPQYAYYSHSPKLIEASLNACLMMKGALLNSENSVKNVVDNSKDESLKDTWDELKADRYLLSKLSEKETQVTKHKADSLATKIKNLEDSLIIKCKEYGDITTSMKMTWRNVQKRLHSEDIAIEFISFPINNDSMIYAALTIRKDDETPKMIILFEDKQLKQITDTIYYQSKDLTSIIWEPIRKELEGVRNIFFSPSSVLYNIGIEYLSGMESFNIYRLSSTRELIRNELSMSENRAVLYGGLNYYSSLDKKETKVQNNLFSDLIHERANVRSLKLRGGKEYLKHTKDEVGQIEKELKKLTGYANLIRCHWARKSLLNP